MTFTSDVWWSDLYLNELKWHLLQQGEKVIFKRFSCYMCDFSIYIIPVQKWSIQYIKIGFLVSVYAKYHCVVSSRGLLIIIFKARCSALWLCKQQRLSPPHSSNRPQESVTLWKKRKQTSLLCVTKIMTPSLIWAIMLVCVSLFGIRVLYFWLCFLIHCKLNASSIKLLVLRDKL